MTNGLLGLHFGAGAVEPQLVRARGKSPVTNGAKDSVRCPWDGVDCANRMLTFRNVLALGVFLFGTTYLWLTPSFVGKSLTGAVWTIAQVLAMATIIGFAVAAWGIFKSAGWWEPVLVVSAFVGIASVLPYWIGIQSVANAVNAAAIENVVGHLLGAAVVISVLLIHPAEHWVVGRLQ